MRLGEDSVELSIGEAPFFDSCGSLSELISFQVHFLGLCAVAKSMQDTVPVYTKNALNTEAGSDDCGSDQSIF